MKRKLKHSKRSINEIPLRCTSLMDGPIKTQVKGTSKGKKGYNRKDKGWKDYEEYD
jgi:hypothetical protein